MLNPQDVMDNEAIQFAICPPMPEFLLRPEIEKLGGLDIYREDCERLARWFKDSTKLMAIRIGQLVDT